MNEFDQFWAAYPRRIAKGHARAAFDKAIRKTTIEKMLSAIADYIRFKPERIDFKHPATWLNGECWDDEWASVPRETNRKRSFLDVAMDRFNHGSAGFQGTDADAGVISSNERQPGSDSERLRIGGPRPVLPSHH
jgi:hypothetical protein